MCIWNVHDFPAFGLFAGCVTKGHKRCPPCGPTTESCSFKKLKKIIYCDNQCYLLRNHPYQRNKNVFNGETEIRNAPPQVLALNTIKWAQEQKLWLKGPRNQPSGKLDPVHKNGIKCLSNMLQLPYWEV